MLKTTTARTARRSALLALLLAVALVLNACQLANPSPKETEIEMTVVAPEATGELPTLVQYTPTLRPTNTPTPAPVATSGEPPTPTISLSPYDALIQEGTTLRDQGEMDSAISKLTEAIKMDPNNARGYIERGITYSAVDRQDEAITDFNFALNYDPNAFEAYNGRGNAYSIKG